MKWFQVIAVVSGLGLLTPVWAQQSGLVAHWTFDEAGAPALVDAPRHDLHLASADECARGHGTDLAAEVPLLGRDVDADARPRGAGVDIGADEVP